ncbi:ORF080L [Infectious spleen and kidney necrosis virus]|uniref:ORF080L n=3 Tax=Infectious spleen and kidney necrosis virus TaxID=180170 RepID=Q8QUN0_ISKNN|nr:ORF080L [Infectious spleen and kidney necrosis virus]QOE77218.1 hypothetical protein [Banggai cardinalfish iridovirus]AAL98804.1 ORF080L [Infectious spleen and kidney necrosis virus]QPO16327.1 hypothetical protein [Infectious spleen and kidney necrosis virus]QPO16447.1 hypothetical protein [Infectious spleen and kidney necrosis virus]UUJ75170.1 hypothetical protein [Infectious spleen and kidney necrosis virus]
MAVFIQRHFFRNVMSFCRNADGSSPQACRGPHGHCTQHTSCTVTYHMDTTGLTSWTSHTPHHITVVC